MQNIPAGKVRDQIPEPFSLLAQSQAIEPVPIGRPRVPPAERLSLWSPPSQHAGFTTGQRDPSD